MAMKSINPATGQVIQVFQEWSTQQTDEVVAKTHHAWLSWRETSMATRAQLASSAARVLREGKESYARLMAQEMGKPINDGRSEVEKCAWACDYYAEHAAGFLAPEPAQGDAAAAYVAFRPLGTLLAVMPWNFPFWQVFRAAIPALMAGNAVVLKHASNVPNCALAVEQVFQVAGFPADLFRTLMIGSAQVEGVLRNPQVKGVTLTGSAEAGRRVAALAGSLLKKSVLELGGSDAFIVLADADLEEAARTAAQSRCINSGQSCIAAKRFIVEAGVFAPFLRHFQKAMQGVVVGDPLQEDTQVGPLAREDLRETVHAQVSDAVQKGAELVLGGKPLEGAGYFYPPTILVGVKPGMRAYSEEIFGPVASVLRVRDLDEAIAVANDTPFGLGATLWTGDTAKAEWAAGRLEAGTVFGNGLLRSDPRLPFGGCKESGYGRELSHFGIREFVNVQAVWVKSRTDA